MMGFIAGCVAGLLCFYAGWVYAHHAIATECSRLGGFYVGETTYHCSAINTPAPSGPPPSPPRPPRD